MLRNELYFSFIIIFLIASHVNILGKFSISLQEFYDFSTTLLHLDIKIYDCALIVYQHLQNKKPFVLGGPMRRVFCIK